MAAVESAIEVYDPETVFESAGKTLLTRDGFPAIYTSENAGITREQTRVEIMFQLGEEADQHEVVDGEPIAAGWRGTLTFQVVVPGGNQLLLRQVKAEIRDKVARWQKGLDAQLPFYHLMSLKGAGATPSFELPNGFLAVTMRYAVLFRLVDGCLVELAASQDNQ